VLLQRVGLVAKERTRKKNTDVVGSESDRGDELTVANLKKVYFDFECKKQVFEFVERFVQLFDVS
jgi:hypothetical protein